MRIKHGVAGLTNENLIGDRLYPISLSLSLVILMRNKIIANNPSCVCTSRIHFTTLTRQCQRSTKTRAVRARRLWECEWERKTKVKSVYRAGDEEQWQTQIWTQVPEQWCKKSAKSNLQKKPNWFSTWILCVVCSVSILYIYIYCVKYIFITVLFYSLSWHWVDVIVLCAPVTGHRANYSHTLTIFLFCLLPLSLSLFLSECGWVGWLVVCLCVSSGVRPNWCQRRARERGWREFKHFSHQNPSTTLHCSAQSSHTYSYYSIVYFYMCTVFIIFTLSSVVHHYCTWMRTMRVLVLPFDLQQCKVCANVAVCVLLRVRLVYVLGVWLLFESECKGWICKWNVL